MKTSLCSRLALFLSLIALLAGLVSPALGQTLPTLTAVERTSSLSIYQHNFVSFVVKHTPGTDTVTSIRLTFSAADGGDVHDLVVNNPGATAVLTSLPGEDFNLTSYRVTRITLTDSAGRATYFDRGGGRSSSPVLAGSPTSHSFDFALLDFQVGSGYDIFFPLLTSVTRTSGDPLTRGVPVAFTLGYYMGGYDITGVAVALQDPVGATHILSLAGNPVVGGQMSLATDASWPDGSYVVNFVSFVDAGSRSITFNRDGSVSTTGGGPQQDRPNVSLAAQDFQLVSAAGTAPILATQPAVQSVFAGDPASFSVVASGSASLTYQWSRNGTALAEGTAATLMLTEVKDSDAGNYSVTVRNSAGSITSAAALLTVFPRTPAFITQPADAGANEGSSFSTTFQVRAPNLPAISWQATTGNRSIPGVMTSGLLTEPNRMTVTVSFGPLRATDAGTYQVVALNAAGATSSEPHRLTVATAIPAIVTQPLSQTAPVSSRVSLSVEAVALGTLFYQWKKNDVAIAGATDSTLDFASVQPSDAGRYTVIVANIVTSLVSDSATLTVVTPPTITTPPANRYAIAGDDVNFTVAASGAAPLSYQWFKGSSPIAGATTATLSLRSVTVADSGFYSVGVTNAGGTIRSATAALSVDRGAPVITAAPVDQSAPAGSTVSFSVTATGAGTLAYQWYRNSVPLSGETRTRLILIGVRVAQAGDYSVAVSNTVDTVRSVAVALVIAPFNPARLINLSVLTSLGSGDSFTLGFVVGGSTTNETKPLLVRAVGPTLGSAFGVAGAHPDPKLEVFSNATKIGENDNWIDDPSRGAQFRAAGAFAFADAASKDAALYLPSLAAGTASMRVSGVGSASGTVLAELYETTPPIDFSLSPSRLINVSVLKSIGAGLTAGFVIGGSGTRTILVRAVGPGLVGFGITDFVADPAIALFNSANVKLGTNDNWEGKDAAVMFGVGAFALPAGSKDAAYVAVALTPGSYTVQVTGAGTAGGRALIEIYEVP